jgi:CheY-like chemotaxis protein
MKDKIEKILIVDDEVSIRQLLSRKLSQCGYLCEEAGSVNEALDLIKNNSFHL